MRILTLSIQNLLKHIDLLKLTLRKYEKEGIFTDIIILTKTWTQKEQTLPAAYS